MFPVFFYIPRVEDMRNIRAYILERVSSDEPRIPFSFVILSPSMNVWTRLAGLQYLTRNRVSNSLELSINQSINLYLYIYKVIYIKLYSKTRHSGFYPYTWWAQLVPSEKYAEGGVFLSVYVKLFINRSIVLAYNKPQTVWRPGSAQSHWGNSAATNLIF